MPAANKVYQSVPQAVLTNCRHPAWMQYGVRKNVSGKWDMPAKLLLIFEECYNETDIWMTELHNCLDSQAILIISTTGNAVKEYTNYPWSSLHPKTARLRQMDTIQPFPPLWHWLCTGTQSYIFFQHAAH